MYSYRLFAIASSFLLLVASSTALTVVDTTTKASVSKHKGRKIHRIKLPAPKHMQNANANACCGDYPYCGCPKLETPKAKLYQIKLPSVVDQSSNACCAEYPFCGCPKLDTKAKTSLLNPIKLPIAAKQATTGSCCPDYPYCTCPKLEAPPKSRRLPVIKIGAAGKRRPRVSSVGAGARPKALAPRQ